MRQLTHDGLLYRTAVDYLNVVVPFIEAGLDTGQPTFVAVPSYNVELVRNAMNGPPGAVEFADMRVVGANPGRIIPAIQQFLDAHPDRQVRFVGEPIWPGRTPAQICEATRHESLINAAFANAAVDILCPYDVSQIDPLAIDNSWRTHPRMIDNAQRHNSSHYAEPDLFCAGDTAQLADPPAHARVVAIEHDDLSDIRDAVRDHAVARGLEPRRTQDLVLAVNEIATNTLVHTEGHGTLGMWGDDLTVVCEIRDGGHVEDLLAGRRRPAQGEDHGRGLWMAHQLCDLLQLRSSAAGTTVRMHMNQTGA